MEASSQSSLFVQGLDLYPPASWPKPSTTLGLSSPLVHLPQSQQIDYHQLRWPTHSSSCTNGKSRNTNPSSASNSRTNPQDHREDAFALSRDSGTVSDQNKRSSISSDGESSMLHNIALVGPTKPRVGSFDGKELLGQQLQRHQHVNICNRDTGSVDQGSSDACEQGSSAHLPGIRKRRRKSSMREMYATANQVTFFADQSQHTHHDQLSNRYHQSSCLPHLQHVSHEFRRLHDSYPLSPVSPVSPSSQEPSKANRRAFPTIILSNLMGVHQIHPVEGLHYGSQHHPQRPIDTGSNSSLASGVAPQTISLASPSSPCSESLVPQPTQQDPLETARNQVANLSFEAGPHQHLHQKQRQQPLQHDVKDEESRLDPSIHSGPNTSPSLTRIHTLLPPRQHTPIKSQPTTSPRRFLGRQTRKPAAINTMKQAVTPARRVAHVLSEQKRREKINDGFEDLRSIIPECADNTDSRSTILRKAVDRILELEEELRKYTYTS
ncbi:MAG: hypothetical protein J3Q66DRAFT_103081 [Benniella sp.]|nr:MAG: hypothetical protein J3Q66DRAFT_103081 [Benniella sp.]